MFNLSSFVAKGAKASRLKSLLFERSMARTSGIWSVMMLTTLARMLVRHSGAKKESPAKELWKVLRLRAQVSALYRSDMDSFIFSTSSSDTGILGGVVRSTVITRSKPSGSSIFLSSSYNI